MGYKNQQIIILPEQTDHINLPYNYIWLLYQDADINAKKYYIKTLLDNDVYLHYEIKNNIINLNFNKGNYNFNIDQGNYLLINEKKIKVNGNNFELSSTFSVDLLSFINVDFKKIKIKTDDNKYLGYDYDIKSKKIIYSSKSDTDSFLWYIQKEKRKR